jgi:hypothetical protein
MTWTQHSPVYLTESPLQKIIKYSQGKDKILKASLTRILKARDLEDELGQECKAIQVLLVRINELTGQQEDERQEKSSKPLRIPFVVTIVPE